MTRNEVTHQSNSCNNCVFSVDNKHCGLQGFISEDEYPHNNCSAWNNEKPNGFELQDNGYFSWIKKVKPRYRPYKDAEEFLKAQKEHGPYINTKFWPPLGLYTIPYSVNNSRVYWKAGYDLYSNWEELSNHEWQDGHPCGILEN